MAQGRRARASPGDDTGVLSNTRLQSVEVREILVPPRTSHWLFTRGYPRGPTVFVYPASSGRHCCRRWRNCITVLRRLAIQFGAEHFVA